MKPVIMKKFNTEMLDYDDIVENSDIADAFSDFSILESEQIYFSAGASEIKEILIQKDPLYSA